ncbi:glycoside hydrolase family 3 C-terminal domain-containing protein [Allokutzneria sp. A3M-2-11 16]|uniref:beta-glucosidase family protein n=1 Tax=Allokutzneria sp. A3M-2-11 16 TaxID=2962043 RepID=UPI0020B7CE4F|nr:glycoside hydrolase family 3 C-terminal domain-containing protein [Allokutzneria sp. A3M-2-11 16]MCP3804664.1 glycoside hydrolase family 3 C-terminal domain-containing protein [Allokutzneria sp. A3M-2-11 16]
MTTSWRRRSTALALACTVALAAQTAPAGAGAGAGQSGSRVPELVKRMTLAEKISMLHWSFNPATPASNIYLPGVARLGIPELRASDGPNGITAVRPSIALPAPIALGASFDEELAGRYGAVLGREARAHNIDVALAPMMNNIRVPTAGRNYETFAEDPVVTARIAAAEIRGIQSQGVIANAKHFAANNQETDRMTIDAEVDERTLRETELPPFESAVRAGVGSFMCSYNKLNGTPACANRGLLTEILRAQWDFRGWVMSDWLAAPSTSAIEAGLDQELGIRFEGIPDPVNKPEATHFAGALRRAVEGGTIAQSTVDTSVTRILTQLERFGMLDGPRPRPARDVAGGTKVAREVAEGGSVLLRNENATLPLSTETAGDIAVIGPTGREPKVSGFGSAYVRPDSATPPLDAIRERMGGKGKVDYRVGEELRGEPMGVALSPAFTSKEYPSGFSGPMYSGTLTVTEPGLYRIAGSLTPDAVATITLDGTTRIEVSEVFGEVSSQPLHLTAGTHKIEVSGTTYKGAMTFSLSWVTPRKAQQSLDEAVAAAKAAKTAVVFVHDDSSENWDRPSLALPGRQDELVAAVAKANPRTVVVLNVGGAITMPWLSSTKAVLNTWYPGQAGAEATTRLLFGDANPSGKLTQTFPADDRTHPVAGHPERFPGVGGKQVYSEGIFTGYRWYDREKAKPLFPFGHGLSYTAFEYGTPVAKRVRDGVEVSFTLRNTGARAGSEIAQVYLGASPDLRLPQAEKALAGYQKVSLRPGEQRRITVLLPGRALRHWDTATHSWALGTGTRAVWVGGSSSALPLRTEIEIIR